MENNTSMRKKSVTIEWSFPIVYSHAYEKEKCSEHGIYYISRVFGGHETLIYIGKTVDCFFNRLKSHDDTWLKTVRGQKYIRFGSILTPKTYDNNLLEDIESAIIYEMQPHNNYMKTCGYTYRSFYFVNISNVGYRGVLPQMIDGKKHAIL